MPVSLQSNKILLDSFLTTLPNCVSREMIDSAAVEFCTNLNTKYNRKKLVRALFTVQRTRLDLLPFYSRLVATLYPYIPEIATDLGNFLKQDFKYHVRKKVSSTLLVALFFWKVKAGSCQTCWILLDQL